MKVTLWGTRGSLAAPGADTSRYGGNTSCAEVRGDDGTVLVLDAGTGIRDLGLSIAPTTTRVDILLTHLHMDHIQGLGFFAPLYNPNIEVHIWGPARSAESLRALLTKYLSPPLFPVHFRDMPPVILHKVPVEQAKIGEFVVDAALICHPGPTVGYRITCGEMSMAYIPDHEPELRVRRSSLQGNWTSGVGLAAGVDLLIHDAQYTDAEYDIRVGWGHSSVRQAFQFASQAGVKHLVPFHHDPTHIDEYLDRLMADNIALMDPPFEVTPGIEGLTFRLAPRIEQRLAL